MLRKMSRHLLVLLFGFFVWIPTQAQGGNANKVRLFILSGQSNMAGLNQKLSFIPTINQAFPDDENLFVKDARGGQPIRRWYRKWVPPEGKTIKDKAKPGVLYDRLLGKVKAAIQNKQIATVSFVWMQGERDAKENLSAVYQKSLAGLIHQLRTDLKRPDMTVVIGRLSDHLQKNSHWEAVRLAQVKVAKSDPLAAWVDTDDLNGANDGLHYNKTGYIELGRRFAVETIALLQKKGNKK